jgi:hypothetical protein
LFVAWVGPRIVDGDVGAGTFGVVHRHVRAAQQSVQLRAVVGGERHPDAGVNVDVEAGHGDRLPQGVPEQVRGGGSAVRGRQTAEQDRELIAAPTG